MAKQNTSNSSTPDFITEHLDIWTSAIKTKSAAGRGSSKKLELVGIKKLRELILELAVRGKLVPQDPNDVPASELLKKIEAEKVRLLQEGKIKKHKPLPPISDDEKSFELPHGWECKKLPDIYYSISPSGKKLKTSDIQEKGKHPVVDQGQEHVSGYSNNDDLLIKLPNPVIVFGDHTRNIKYIDFDFIAGADGTKILCPILVFPRYLYLHLHSYDLESRGYGRHFKILNDNVFSIPPEAEQHRIVAKVDELMALCDQLEAQTEASIDAHKTLVEVLLATLTDAKDADELNDNWQTISQHFDVLFTTQASIDQLKQTILQLAVMGKLVKQNPKDEPASKLLERIATEKQQLIKDGKIKKQKPLPPIAENEKPFELPQGWEWAKLRVITTGMDSGWSPACLANSSPSEDVWGVLKTTAVQVMEYLEFENKELPEKLKPRPLAEVKTGDILFTRAGPMNRVGISCLVQNTRPKLMISDKIIRFHPMEIGIYGRFIALCLNAGATAAYLEDAKSGMAASQVNITQEKLAAAPIPIAPMAQQQRIVAKVDELMTLCDSLKERLNQAQTSQLQLTEAIVEQAL
jgi:type I restriction enzyme S subunit